MITFDKSKISWMFEGALQWDPQKIKTEGVKIKNCITDQFESYCKVFHPFELLKGETDSLVEKKETFGRFDLGYNVDEWTQVSWAGVAHKYGVYVNNEVNPKRFEDVFNKIGWPLNLSFPSEGYLPQSELNVLLLILGGGKVSEMIILQEPPHTIWKYNDGDDCQVANVTEVTNYFSENGFIGYLGDMAHKWLMFTDTDLSFTIVGGSKDLIRKIMESDLEALECTAMTRVDDFA